MAKLDDVFMEIKILKNRKDEIYKRSIFPIDKKIENLKRKLNSKEKKILEELLAD